MKKISSLILGITTVLLSYGYTYAADTVTFDDNTTWTCDQSFAPKLLRFGYYYGFFDNFTNNNSSTYNNYINTYAVQYKNANYLGVGGAFAFTPELKALNYIVAPQQTLKVLATTDNNWRVLRHPATRSTGSNYDFMIGYKIGYDTSGNYPDASDDKYHTECQPYQVTWCGDGIVDSEYEKCDDGAQNGMPGKCNISCDATLPPDEKTTCDQTFPPQTLRYGDDAYFYDSYTNNDGFDHRMKKFDVLFTEPYDYNTSPAFPTFDWTQPLKDANYIVKSGTQNQKIIEAKTPYTIRSVPPKRGPDNLMVKYRVYVENANQTSQVVSHLECQPYEISWCGDGVLDTQYGEQCDPAAPGQSPATCDPVTCKPKEATPQCSSTITGTQPNPISATTSGLCAVGVVDNFRSTTATDGTINYTWNCIQGGAVVSPQPTPPVCTANYRPTTPVDITIKKYAKTITPTGDSETAPVQIALGETFNYYYVFENTNTTAINNVVIKDTFPEYLSYTGNIIVANPQGQDVTSDWTITKGTYPGTTRITLLLKKKTPLPANSGKYTVTIPVTLAANAPTTNSMRNVAYICGDGTTPVTGPSGEPICGNDNPPPPPNQPCTPENNPHKDPACIIPTAPTGMDLAIKKYIGTNDAQPGAPVTQNTGDAINYILRVQNIGAVTATGTTTVRDILPVGVEMNGVATGPNWTITYTTGSRLIEAVTTQQVASGAYFSDITVPVRVTAGASSTVRNDATVHNPNETNPCYADNRMPTGNEQACTRDPRNTDPAVFVTPGPGGGGTSYVGKKCVNNQATCVGYGSFDACIADLRATDTDARNKCYPSDSVGMNRCQNESLICSTGGGPGPNPPPGGGGYRCGDGALQPGEECDVIGASWCVSCKVTTVTIPGANPIISMWIKIPQLGNRNVGTNGYVTKNLSMDDTDVNGYRVVVGQGTNIFTLADQVVFGMKTEYRAPVMLEENKRFCLVSEGNAFAGQSSACTRVGDMGLALTPINGKNYLLLGAGDYQVKNGNTYQTITIANPKNEVPFFRGSQMYSPVGQTNLGPTLRDAFRASNLGDGSIFLIGCAAGENCTNPSSNTRIIQIPVKVSAAMVSSVGSAANRALQTFVGNISPFSSFLSTTSFITSTTSTNNATTVVSRPVQAIPSMNGQAGGTVTTVTELIQRYAVNGNQAILAVKGDLTVACPTGSTVFTMEGVRTVIVEGNLNINCNIGYASGDASSSWAWIAKNGDIKVYNGQNALSDGAVTNMAGVYVAIKETQGGTFNYSGNNTTQKILRVDGSFYGNAEPLFKSRLYARATGGYDILTTGTIINYSNRALMNPPPLLSQYLGNYQVQRVVQ